MSTTTGSLSDRIEALAAALALLAREAEVLEAAGVKPVPNDLAQHRARFPECVELIIKEEGGEKFTMDPDDPGGATKFGITLATLTRWRGRTTTADDVRAIQKPEAVAIYEKNYWLHNRCDQMPLGVDLCVFDFTVPSGGAIVVVQRVLGVKLDGAVGPQTLGAIQAREPGELIEAISAARLAYMRGLSHWWKYGNGWTSRVERIRRLSLATLIR